MCLTVHQLALTSPLNLNKMDEKRVVKCCVVGAQGVGKTTFIYSFIYALDFKVTASTPASKTYRYSLAYPPPSRVFELLEVKEFESSYSPAAVFFLYDNSRPETLDYALSAFTTMKTLATDLFLGYLVEISHLPLTLQAGPSAAKAHGLKFCKFTLKNKGEVRRVFEKALKFTYKDRRWLCRRALLSLRIGLSN
jgi:hypothetical protein